MACYNPFSAFPIYELGKSSTGNYRYKIECAWHPNFADMYPDVIKVPCGKCLGCRLDRARDWADRMTYELAANDGKAIFVTLTYDPEHVPYAVTDEGELVGFSLCKRDLQLFFKRLRRRFADHQIRFYACGEMGAKTHRPHYHAIIFGLTLADFDDLSKRGVNELGHQYFTSPKFSSIWQNGFILMSEVSYKTCAYVARYCMKKAFAFSENEYCEPEFSLMSRRPGIGKPYFENLLKDGKIEDFFSDDFHYFSDHNGSSKVGLPKYFMDNFKLTNPDLFDKISVHRRELSHDKEMLELQRTSLSYLDQLELKYNTLLNKTQILFNRREEFNDAT